MKAPNLNYWFTLLANLGVLAGIVFLAIEIQQNTEMMRAQTRDEMAGKLSDWQVSVSSDLYFSELYLRGNNGGDLDIEAGEAIAYRLLIQSNLTLWENEWYQYQLGLFDEDEFTPRLNRWRGGMGTLGYRSIWAASRNSYSSSFRELIDTMTNDTESVTNDN